MTMAIQNDTLTRLRASADTDTYGDPLEDWSTPDELEISGWTVYPLPVDTDQDPARTVLQRRWQCIGPVDADVTGLDRIRYRGTVYLIAGEPQFFQTGVLDHVEMILEDFRG